MCFISMTINENLVNSWAMKGTRYLFFGFKIRVYRQIWQFKIQCFFQVSLGWHYKLNMVNLVPNLKHSRLFFNSWLVVLYHLSKSFLPIICHMFHSTKPLNWRVFKTIHILWNGNTIDYCKITVNTNGLLLL